MKGQRLSISLAVALASAFVHAQSLFNNAIKAGLNGEGLITGARPGGGFYSEVQAGNAAFGASFRRTTYWLADDFEVSGGRWKVKNITVWGFQDNLHFPSINQGFCEIRKGSYVGQTVATALLQSNELTDIYRIPNARPMDMFQCQKLSFGCDALLGPGKYWIVVAALGVVNVNGPWSPFLTKVGALTVPGANAMVRVSGTTIYWNQLFDPGSFAPLDIPFWVDGEKLPLLAPRGEKIDPHPPTPDPVAALMRLG